MAAADDELPTMTATVDLSRSFLSELPDVGTMLRHCDPPLPADDTAAARRRVTRLQADHNSIQTLPTCVVDAFANLSVLDVSDNRLTHIGDELLRLERLEVLLAKNNLLETTSLPKDFGRMASLKTLNLGGNCFQDLPPQVTEMANLTRLFLGNNQIRELPVEIGNMTSLEVLYLGGNYLSEIPATVGYLSCLTALILCDNQLHSLPSTVCHLSQLQSLSLHDNRLTTLPPELTKLNLLDLSLRNNPLVVKFVQDMVYEPPTLLELAARRIKIKNIQYSRKDLPQTLVAYLSTAKRCVNPKCKGVYFDSHIKQVNFVDFCGKYRLPLLEYLCLPTCNSHPVVLSSTDEDSDGDDDAAARSSADRIKKVLLSESKPCPSHRYQEN
ncbi:PREDICTED: leucine-rich repeat-containing protein 58-like [Priapulus caudatus]|uniref:Leucine-rich repeat-containing protein 58-like n=1 Tax=Priapulus caudatus TaxID=37621 RepID=A0ABM1EFQ3_PRICU|nr:PREDICTED: leucine-rich repeat-containing protein 58-like [Priapulus caudatus]XP_014671024.1 PREDICTED: leucine-rich repeat-containing protein 58-like [Priapulus caudatus]